jgi:hypothetical protein
MGFGVVHGRLKRLRGGCSTYFISVCMHICCVGAFFVFCLCVNSCTCACACLLHSRMCVIFMYACVQVCVSLLIFGLCVQIPAVFIYIYIYIYIHIYIYICIYIFIYIYIYIYWHTCIYVSHMYIHTRTYMTEAMFKMDWLVYLLRASKHLIRTYVYIWIVCTQLPAVFMYFGTHASMYHIRTYTHVHA